MSASPVPLRRNRDFVLLQSGQLLSNLGTQLTVIAYPLLVLALTGSPAKAGFVGFARFLPRALFALPAGLLADHWNRKRLMVGADAVRVVAVGAARRDDRARDRRLLGDPVIAFVEGTAARVLRRGVSGRRPLGRLRHPASGRDGRPDRQRRRRPARGRADRRRALHGRPRAAVRRRRPLVRVLARLACCSCGRRSRASASTSRRRCALA